MAEHDVYGFLLLYFTVWPIGQAPYHTMHTIMYDITDFLKILQYCAKLRIHYCLGVLNSELNFGQTFCVPPATMHAPFSSHRGDDPFFFFFPLCSAGKFSPSAEQRRRGF
jgi:hypothetical protein